MGHYQVPDIRNRYYADFGTEGVAEAASEDKLLLDDSTTAVRIAKQGWYGLDRRAGAWQSARHQPLAA